MADLKISALTDGATADGTDKIPVERAGANKYVTPTYIQTFLGFVAGILATAKGGTGSAYFTVAGPTVARVYTFPDAAATIARTDAAQSFTGVQTFVAPILGTPTSGTMTNVGGTAASLTAGAVTGLSVTAGKTLTASNSITLAGTDSTTMTFPPASASIGYLGTPLNSQSAAYTTVLADAGKTIYHPTTDNVARTFTIDSNANVAYPVGTTITFVNEKNTVTIAITTDTMTLAGGVLTGSRTLATVGVATALKVTSTSWVISGTGLT